jgi:hypothetical protein
MVCPKCGAFLWWAAPPGLLQRPSCAQCGSRKTVKLYRVIAANGVNRIVWYCVNCQCYAKDGNRLWLPNPLVSEFLAYWIARAPDLNIPTSIGEVPLLKDNTGDEPCAICGAAATEYNHFMPQVFKNDPDIASDWTEWDRLGAWLCDKHHKLWHVKVAPLTALARVRQEMVR